MEHQEGAVLSAIEHGDLTRVGYLLNCGVITPHTLLHSPIRRESATVVGTAALEGQTDIIKYIFQSHKHQVNYRDPALGRTALHWSCTGGHVEASRLLLQHNADVNCCDRDTVTPVLRAALSGCTELLELLVQAGAQVLHRDRLNATALHYASFHGRHHQVELLIKSGCVQNNHTVFGHGTPLANVIYHRDFSNAVLLVEAGYNLSNDKWVLSVKDLPRGPLSITRRRRKADNDREDEWSEEDVLKLLKHEASNPRCLLRSCRTAIRACMGGVHVQAKLNKLPLPSTMIRYLSLN